MTDRKFNEPKLRINRVYTKTGDRGQTCLAGGQRVSKNDPRIRTYGHVDELNAQLGHARTLLRRELSGTPQWTWFSKVLIRLQHHLFNLGSSLATLPEDIKDGQPVITAQHVTQLERDIDLCNEELDELRSFVLPGGSPASSAFHICRTICRRAERELVGLMQLEPVDENCLHFLNRLSDAFFVWSRWINKRQAIPETLWDPNQS